MVLSPTTDFTSFISIKHRRKLISSLCRFCWRIWHFRIQLIIPVGSWLANVVCVGGQECNHVYSCFILFCFVFKKLLELLQKFQMRKNKASQDLIVQGSQQLCSLTVFGNVYELREKGIASHWHQKGRFVSEGDCKYVLEGRMHPGGSDSTELMEEI